MTKKPKPCPHCAAGNQPRDGEHWIVKSISPAKITIKPCKAQPSLSSVET